MYYDDRFDPTNVDEDAKSVDSNKNKNKVSKLLAEMKTYDKGFFQLTRTVLVNDVLKKKKISCYGSGQHGTTIRDAVSGEMCYGDLVGSNAEKNYYKVKICTGEIGQTQSTLFYHSKGEYERHMHCVK